MGHSAELSETDNQYLKNSRSYYQDHFKPCRNESSYWCLVTQTPLRPGAGLDSGVASPAQHQPGASSGVTGPSSHNPSHWHSQKWITSHQRCDMGWQECLFCKQEPERVVEMSWIMPWAMTLWTLLSETLMKLCIRSFSLYKRHFPMHWLVSKSRPDELFILAPGNKNKHAPIRFSFFCNCSI